MDITEVINDVEAEAFPAEIVTRVQFKDTHDHLHRIGYDSSGKRVSEFSGSIAKGLETVTFTLIRPGMITKIVYYGAEDSYIKRIFEFKTLTVEGARNHRKLIEEDIQREQVHLDQARKDWNGMSVLYRMFHNQKEFLTAALRTPATDNMTRYDGMY